jgi:hypothetical protein
VARLRRGVEGSLTREALTLPDLCGWMDRAPSIGLPHPVLIGSPRALRLSLLGSPPHKPASNKCGESGDCMRKLKPASTLTVSFK